MNTPNTQMELNLDNGPRFRATERQQTRMERAQWWFARIRQVVDAAAAPQPVPEPRPLQERLGLAA